MSIRFSDVWATKRSRYSRSWRSVWGSMGGCEPWGVVGDINVPKVEKMWSLWVGRRLVCSGYEKLVKELVRE